jgi:hypothetical protein
MKDWLPFFTAPLLLICHREAKRRMAMQLKAWQTCDCMVIKYRQLFDRNSIKID